MIKKWINKLRSWLNKREYSNSLKRTDVYKYTLQEYQDKVDPKFIDYIKNQLRIEEDLRSKLKEEKELEELLGSD